MPNSAPLRDMFEPPDETNEATYEGVSYVWLVYSPEAETMVLAEFAEERGFEDIPPSLLSERLGDYINESCGDWGVFLTEDMRIDSVVTWLCQNGIGPLQPFCIRADVSYSKDYWSGEVDAETSWEVVARRPVDPKQSAALFLDWIAIGYEPKNTVSWYELECCVALAGESLFDEDGQRKTSFAQRHRRGDADDD